MKKNNRMLNFERLSNKILISLLMFLVLFLIFGTSYALWNLTFRQTSTNQINTSCFKIDFTEKDDINLSDAYPLTDEEAKNLSPYTFTITNICDTSATYQVNLEELEVEGKKLSNQYINLSLNDKTGKLSTFEEVAKTLDNAAISHKLTTGVLKEKESKSFELRLWLREDSPSTEEVMNASFLSKITIITVYKKNIPEVSSLAYENLDTIKVGVNTISNPDNETLDYYYQLDDNTEIKINTGTHTFANLQDGTYKIKVRVEDTNGIVIFEKEENVVVAYEHVYVSSTGNDTTGNGSQDLPYATLQRAYNKVKSGGEILLLSDITATSSTNMNIGNKEVTIKSNGNNTYSVFRGSSLKTPILDINNSNNVTTTNIIFDGKNIDATGSLIEGHYSTITLGNNTILQNNINIGRNYTEWGSSNPAGGSLGGAIFLWNCNLEVDGALIQKNTVDNARCAQGGGLYLYNSTTDFNSGIVKNNDANGPSTWSDGGGIIVFGGTFTLNNGSVINNTAKQLGGGLYTVQNGTVYLKGGIIENNTAPTGANAYALNGSQIIDQR